MAALVTFFSASQDIVVDAYRREDLSDAELGAGSSLYISGYRLGMLLAGGGGLILADRLPQAVTAGEQILVLEVAQVDVERSGNQFSNSINNLLNHLFHGLISLSPDY